MNNRPNKKYSLGLIPSSLISTIITSIVASFVFLNPDLNAVWGVLPIRWMIIISLAICFIGGIFIMSGAHYRLRDRMVRAVRGSSGVSKVMFLILIMVTLGAAAGAVIVTVLLPLYKAAGS